MKKVISILLLVLLQINVVFAQNWDIDLLRNINNNRNQHFDPFFKVISDNTAAIAYGVPASFLVVSFIKKDSLMKQKALVQCGSLLSSAVFSTVLKYTINRERPFVTYPFIQKIGEGGSPSFPSGHTTCSFAMATSLSLTYPKWYVIAPSFVWASSVAYSRMHLGVHYPSDVLVGAILGSGSAYLTYKVNKWLRK